MTDTVTVVKAAAPVIADETSRNLRSSLINGCCDSDPPGPLRPGQPRPAVIILQPQG